MNFEEPDILVGVELEVSVEHINADNDPVFTKTFLTLILAILIKMMRYK